MAKKVCKRCQQIRVVAIFVCLVAVLLLSMMGQSQAEIYKYTDDQGKKVYVGSLSQVPEQYRHQLQLQRPSDEVSNVSSSQNSEGRSSNATGTAILKRGEIRRLEHLLSMLETKVVVKNNQVLVPVTVTYHGKDAQVTMLMDTGASGTVFHRDALEKLEASSESAGYARVAGGGIIKVSSVLFDKVQVGPFQAKGINSFVIDNKSPGGTFDGLLGMDFLMNVKYRLDLKGQKIIWDPERHEETSRLVAELKAQP